MIKSICLISFTILLLISCNNLVQEKEDNLDKGETVSTGKSVKANSIAGKWSLEAMKTNGATLKAPGLTIYSFENDNSYSMSLYKDDKAVNSYKGSYKYDDAKKVLITDYNIEGPQHDEAEVLLLNTSDLQLVDIKTKDTLLFKSYVK